MLAWWRAKPALRLIVAAVAVVVVVIAAVIAITVPAILAAIGSGIAIQQ